MQKHGEVFVYYDYIGSISWLKAVRERLGESVVFALDEALMCQGSFGGRDDEYIVWVYGDDSVTQYNGVVVLGNYIFVVKKIQCHFKSFLRK